MLSRLYSINRSLFFWIVMIFVCISMESIALYYQYVLDYGPCVLCVQIRAWILALLVVSIVGLVLRNTRIGLIIANMAGLAASAGMLECAYNTLGIERGFIAGSCTLNSGFPAWLALDKWLPSVFEPWEACGYTPELLFKITMAEGLIVVAAGWLVMMLIMLAVSLKNSRY